MPCTAHSILRAQLQAGMENQGLMMQCPGSPSPCPPYPLCRIIKNSWGTNWPSSGNPLAGYFYMSMVTTAGAVGTSYMYGVSPA